MALKVWLPLNGNLNNQGLSNLSFTNENVSNLVVDNNGKIGKCYSRPTKQTAGRIISDKTINLDNNFTMCCWANVSDGIASANGLVSNHDHSSNTGVGINVKYISSTDFRISCSTGTGTGRTYESYYGTTNIKDTWHHLALTYDKTAKQLLLYVDGVVEYTLNNYLNASKEDYIMLFEWSTNYNQTNYRPAAKLNDVRIYDEALSPKQIKEISKGLIAHYKLDNQFRSNRNITLGYYGPTTNSGWGGHRGNANYTNEEDNSKLPFSKIIKFVVTYDTSLGTGGGTSVYPTTSYYVSGNTQYTYSIYIKSEDDLSYMNGNFLYRYEYDTNGTKLIEGGVCARERKEEIGNGWYRIWGTFTTQENTVRLTLPFYTYCGKNNVYYLGGEQLELGDTMTPYIDATYVLSLTEEDCSGNGYNGKVNGTLKYNPDSARYSGSTTFDGTTFTDYIWRPQFDFLTGPLTYNCWVYQTSATPTTQFIMSQGRDYGTYGFNLGAVSGVPRMWVGGTSQAIINGTTSLVDNKWHMLTGTWDGVTAKLYVDGAVVGSAAMADIGYAQSSGAFVIGKMSYNYTSSTTYFPFAGSISDAKVYATALSADEILTMYKNSGIIDNKGNVYTYEFIENDNNIFESENIQKYTTNRSSNGYGQIVTRAGEPAIAINPSTFWQTTETQKGIILRDEIIPNQQYYLDLWIDGDDVVYNNNNVSQGIKIRYTDDSSENLTVVGDQTDKKGFQHIQYITPANKSVYSIEQTYYVGIPNYYRWDTIICPLNKVNLTQQGIWNTTNISANSNKAKLHMSGTIYSNDISEI